VRILGISGSLRAGSHNTRLLYAAARELPDGAELDLWHGLAAIPPYNEDEDDQVPPPVAELKAALADADAVLFATPEYNSSIPGQLKNAIDWASRPFAENPLRGKPVGVVGASTNAFGALWAQDDLRRVLARLGARVLEGGLPVSRAPERFDESGELVDQEIRDGLRGVLVSLAAEAEQRQALAA
jgi:chromate reductase, NAD(P)H dehydrogenase (quinone)